MAVKMSLETVGNKNPRYHGLDALRGIAMLLGILVHASIPYFSRLVNIEWMWPADDDQSVVLLLLFDFIHAWRMPLFFFAGWLLRSSTFGTQGTSILDFKQDYPCRVAFAHIWHHNSPVNSFTLDLWMDWFIRSSIISKHCCQGPRLKIQWRRYSPSLVPLLLIAALLRDCCR